MQKVTILPSKKNKKVIKMDKNFFEIVMDIIFFLYEAPYRILYLIVFIGLCYCVAMILVGFPCSIWEAITKKKIPNKIQDKIILAITICLVIVLLLNLLNENAT